MQPISIYGSCPMWSTMCGRHQCIWETNKKGEKSNKAIATRASSRSGSCMDVYEYWMTKETNGQMAALPILRWEEGAGAILKNHQGVGGGKEWMAQ